jgi:hypothetical protein
VAGYPAPALESDPAFDPGATGIVGELDAYPADARGTLLPHVLADLSVVLRTCTDRLARAMYRVAIAAPPARAMSFSPKDGL